MTSFVFRRLVQGVPVLLLASLVVFSMLQLVPGDPIDAMLGAADNGLSISRPDVVQRIRSDMGLDQPLPIQYVRWLAGAVHGDFGMSYVRRRPVSDVIVERLPSTLELAGAGMLVAVVVGLGLGLAAALKRNSPI